MRDRGQFKRLAPPVLEIVQRAAADDKVVSAPEEIILVLAEMDFGKQTTSDPAEIRNIVRMVLIFDVWEKSLAVEVEVADAATPIEYRQRILFSRRERQHVAITHHHVVVRSIFARGLPRQMRNAQRPLALQIPYQGGPVLFVGIRDALIVPAYDGVPALGHILHIGENVIENVFEAPKEVADAFLYIPAQKGRAKHFTPTEALCRSMIHDPA